MSSRKSSLPGTLWIVLAAVVLWLLWAGFVRRIPVRPAEESPRVPALVMRDSEGRLLSLAELRGKIVLLNLWASWCGPCRDEAPRLTRIQRDLGDDGVVVVGLNAEGLGPAALARLRPGWGIDYTVASSLRPLAGTLYEGEGAVPHNWIIDRQGRLRVSLAGSLPESALRRALTTLLEEAARPGGSGAATGLVGAGEHALAAE